MFNPNQQLPDFAAQQATLEQQKKMAEYLRKRAGSQQAPQSQMVGKHYVAPHWSEYLGGLLENLQAGQAERKYGEAEKAYAGQVGKAQQDWQSSLPQATAAIPGSAGYGSVGPEDDAMPGQMPVDAKPVTMPQVLQHTLAGMNIPGNEKAAGVYNQAALGEINREDMQAARKEEKASQDQARRENLIATMQGRKEELEMKLADAALTRADRAAYQKMHNETLRVMNATMADARRYAADQTRESAKYRADAAGDRPGKPLANAVHTEMSELDTLASSMQGVLSSFKPEYGGAKGAVKASMGAWMPEMSPETSQWWKDYRMNVQLPKRHAIFGGTLTGNEQAAWQAADIESWMTPELIMKNLKIRANLAEKAYEETRVQRGKGGHNVDAAFPTRGFYQPTPNQTPAAGPVTPGPVAPAAAPLNATDKARLEYLREQKRKAGGG